MVRNKKSNWKKIKHIDLYTCTYLKETKVYYLFFKYLFFFSFNALINGDISVNRKSLILELSKNPNKISVIKRVYTEEKKKKCA